MSKNNSDSKIFYGWWIVAAAFVVMAFAHGIVFNCNGQFIKPMQKAFFRGQSQHSFGQRVLCGARRPAVGQICIQGIRQIVLRTVPGKRHHGAAVQRFIITFVDIQNETAPFPAKPHTISRLLYYKIPVLGMRFP